MPYAKTQDGVKLYYEEVGQGTPILFEQRVISGILHQRMAEEILDLRF